MITKKLGCKADLLAHQQWLLIAKLGSWITNIVDKEGFFLLAKIMNSQNHDECAF